MNAQPVEFGSPAPLIDEVRGVRRAICEDAGHDVERLAEQLAATEADYRARRGAFADVPTTPVEHPFPDVRGSAGDPMLEDLHRQRQGRR